MRRLGGGTAGRRGGRSAVALAILLLAGTVPVGAEPADLLVLESGADSSSHRWTGLPDGARCLGWAGGCLVLEAGVAAQPYGADGLALAAPGLVAVDRDGRLELPEGTFRIDRPLLVAGPGVRLLLARGLLDRHDRRLLVRDLPPVSARRQSASYLLLAGLALLTFVLLARVRRRLGRR